MRVCCFSASCVSVVGCSCHISQARTSACRRIVPTWPTTTAKTNSTARKMTRDFLMTHRGRTPELSHAGTECFLETKAQTGVGSGDLVRRHLPDIMQIWTTLNIKKRRNGIEASTVKPLACEAAKKT